jgi:hypothetical protein
LPPRHGEPPTRKKNRGDTQVSNSFEVGDWVLVRTDGRSPAAQKYAGEEGLVTMVAPGLDDETILDVRVNGNNFDTVFEESDLVTRQSNKR